MSKNDNRRILLTAAAEKQTLAAVRSLGRSGFIVDVIDSKRNAPAMKSRYCNEAILGPSNQERKAYTEFLLARLASVPYLTLLPCDDLTARYISEDFQRFSEHTQLAMPTPEVFKQATNKATLVQLVQRYDIPVPETYHPQTMDDLEPMASRLGFPLILKGAHGWGSQHVSSIQRPEDLQPQAQRIAQLEDGRLPMLQEFIPGVGYGFTALYVHGELRAHFMHRRASEFDVQSGKQPYSCPMAISVHEPELMRLGTQLFEALNWHGLGMAEWRRDARNGKFVLMEINPRLVGSTDLAIRCGVDFPTLAARLILEGDIDPISSYPADVRMRWLLPDGLHDLLARPKDGLLQHFNQSSSDWCWRDLSPHWMQLRLSAWQIRQKRRP